MAKQPMPTLNDGDDEVTGTLAPPFERVLWSLGVCTDDDVFVTYAGTPEDLIAAGCCPPDMLAPYQKGKTQRDEHGGRVMRQFRKGWLRLTRYLSVEHAIRMPGINLGVVRRAKALNGARRPWLAQYPDLSAYDRPRPQLRLVVDNTR